MHFQMGLEDVLSVVLLVNLDAFFDKKRAGTYGGPNHDLVLFLKALNGTQLFWNFFLIALIYAYFGC